MPGWVTQSACPGGTPASGKSTRASSTSRKVEPQKPCPNAARSAASSFFGSSQQIPTTGSEREVGRPVPDRRKLPAERSMTMLFSSPINSHSGEIHPSRSSPAAARSLDQPAFFMLRTYFRKLRAYSSSAVITSAASLNSTSSTGGFISGSIMTESQPATIESVMNA